MFDKSSYKIQAILTALCLVFILVAMFIEKNFGENVLFWICVLIAFTSGSIYALKNAWESIKQKELDVDFLMIVAALGATLVGYWHEGATLLFLFSLSNTLQEYAFNRSRKAINSLLKSSPKTANVIRNLEEVTVAVEEVALGEILIIRPGEQVAIDGIIEKGNSDLDESSVTGESTPVDKEQGDKVFSGSLNGVGTLEVRTTHLSQNSTLSRMIQLVETAQQQKARTQRIFDDIEHYYVYIVLAGVVLLILIPWGLMGDPFGTTFYRAMTFLVVASPCALVIATPAVILSAITCAARGGVLFKGGVHLENLSEVVQITLDKTGTITTGKLVVTDVVVHEDIPKEFTRDNLLQLAATLESRSEHPIAKAVVNKAKEDDLELHTMEKFVNLPGRGTHARINKYLVWIGGARLYQEHGEVIPDSLQAVQEKLEKEGKTVLLLHREINREDGVGEHEKHGGWLGVIAVADRERGEAAGAIAKLHKSGIKHIAMLTGDNPFVAQAVADKAGIDEVYSRLMPEEKVTILQRLQKERGPLMMVGDGINDAPALAHASVGVAMGAAGTDAAVESADIVLMGDDLNRLNFAYQLSKKSARLIRFNIAFALAVIALLVAAVFLFQLPLPVGVLGHEGSTLVVVLNGMRLLFFKEDS